LPRPLGIDYGKFFNPDERQRRILCEAAIVGELIAEANSSYKRSSNSRYRFAAHWDYLILVDRAQDLPV